MLCTSHTHADQLVSQLGFEQLGWMAMGFGSRMPDTPIVVTWPNDDGSITLSQRQAPAHIMPTVVDNPEQTATLEWDNSILATNSTSIAFTLPLPTASLNAVPLIWAYSTQRPSSSAVDAALVQHDNMGTFTIDLTQPMNALPTGTAAATGTSTQVVGPTPTGRPSNSGNAGPDVVLSASQRKIRTHGILMSVGFLVLLPLGVFIARFSRTIPFLKDKWFTAHWFVQFVLSGPIIFAGWALGYQFAGNVHFQDNHTRAGLALLILYLIQLAWGTIIHFFKPARKPLPPLAADATTPDADPEKHLRLPTEQSVASHLHSSASSEAHTTTAGVHSTMGLTSQGRTAMARPSARDAMVPAITGRPPQNYGHAILGLAIIALAFYNVHEGYDTEWPKVFGTPIIPSVYLIGLTLLPRQWKQETDARRALPSQSQNARTPSP
ncbi:hypothetical protein FRC00_003195 [Tulasnella sp. 408]|nr:hypothetical protein FRC00_003195 [Tulasnella sp. 408]